jgi:hypothetical protein
MIRTSLLVGTFRSQSACFPLSFRTLRMYLPSGEMAACSALPVFVTWVIEKFWNGAVPRRCTKE